VKIEVGNIFIVFFHDVGMDCAHSGNVGVDRERLAIAADHVHGNAVTVAI
jgi:hypothetical protein